MVHPMPPNEGGRGDLLHLAVSQFPFLLYSGNEDGLHSQGCED